MFVRALPWARRSAVMVSLIAFAGLSTSPAGAVDPPVDTFCFVVAHETVTITQFGETELEVEPAPEVGAACFATEGQLQLAVDNLPGDWTVIGIDFGRANFEGAQLWHVVPNGVGCSTGKKYHAATMPEVWDDRVSSAAAAGGCSVFKHFQLPQFLGDRIVCTCSTMGNMNNETSSEKWRQ